MRDLNCKQVNGREHELSRNEAEHHSAKVPLHRGLSEPGQSTCPILSTWKVLSCDANVVTVYKTKECLQNQKKDLRPRGH